MEDDFTITITDLRRAGHCSVGARDFFERNGINFRDFLRNGILASELAATGDAQALQVVERTKAHRK